MTNNNTTTFFESPSSPEKERFVDVNLDISERVMYLLAKKGWSQKDFAIQLGKSEVKLSKWLSGIHNLNLKSISKMEALLGENIIETPHVDQ